MGHTSKFRVRKSCQEISAEITKLMTNSTNNIKKETKVKWQKMDFKELNRGKTKYLLDQGETGVLPYLFQISVCLCTMDLDNRVREKNAGL